MSCGRNGKKIVYGKIVKSYHTTMQTIPLEFREQVYFFPLGSIKGENTPIIEIQLILEPYFNEGSAQAGRERRRVTPP